MTTKRTQETKDALREGANEIERLRRINETLAIKAQAFETFSQFCSLLTPRPNQGYAPDAVWILRKLLAQIEADEVASAQKAQINGEHAAGGQYVDRDEDNASAA